MPRSDDVEFQSTNMPPSLSHTTRPQKLLTIPGKPLGKAYDSLMPGHGLYLDDSGQNRLKASVAGRLKIIDQLGIVETLCVGNYNGQIGDIVIGRVVDLESKCWRIDILSHSSATLQLSYVNLPGGEMRRRSEKDERAMRNYLSEGDLISAEIQSIQANGRIFLHTRNLKYGKLGEGILISVMPSLIKRTKSHFCILPCGVAIIFGMNGYIWIESVETGSINNPAENLDADSFANQNSKNELSKNELKTIIRAKVCIEILAENRNMLHDASLASAYDLSIRFDLDNLKNIENRKFIASQVRIIVDNNFKTPSSGTGFQDVLDIE
ncbi:MAG: Exosome complex component RRP4 [Marteilia pararefringens]